MGDTRKKENILNSTMSLGDHLEELRTRLIFAIIGVAVGTVVCFILGPHLLRFIEMPYNNLKAEYGLSDLKVLAPADAFMMYMKISLIGGLILSSPWVFYQLWMFVAVGLYEREKRYVRATVPFSAILFIGGAMFFLFLIAPITLIFFLKFGRAINIEVAWTLREYVSFMITLTLVFGLAFQTPIAIFILNRIGLVSLKALCSSRKYVVLGVVIVASMVIPGSDTFSLFALAIPLYMLFELGILLCYVAQRKKKSPN
jgi:sec-independent protein translocase protein TatC